MDQNLPLKLDVFVDNEGDPDRNERKVPAGHEHDGDAEDGAQDGEGPVVVLEAGPPVWRLEEGQERAGHVDKAVAHQEEHTEHDNHCS